MNQTKTKFIAVLLLFAIGIGLIGSTAYAQDFINFLPPSASNFSGEIDDIFWYILYITGFFFFLVVIVLIYFMIRYRAKKPGEEGINFHGHMGLEIAWTIVPAIIFIIIAIFSADILERMDHPPDNSLRINVEAKQFGWRFIYPDSNPTDSIDDSVSSSTTMYMPVNYPVRLDMQSEKVLHAFWVPAFRVKQDILPGTSRMLWFEAILEGEFEIKCAELCGAGHSEMRGMVIVQTQEEFDSWLASERQKKAGASEEVNRGQALYDQHCFSCHSVSGSRGAGPSWLGLYGRNVSFDDGTTTVADEAYLESSIRNPGENIVATFQNIMPAFNSETISDSGIQDIIAFIKTLTSDGSESSETDSTNQEGTASDSDQISGDNSDNSGADQTEDNTGESGGEVNLVTMGEQLSTESCLFCHTTDGTPLVGPSWLGLYGKTLTLNDGSTKVVADDAYLKESIQDPGAKLAMGSNPGMPPFPQLSDEEIEAIIEYIKTLTN
jgi:cytochrome c oxidase subunit 2